MAAGRFRRVPLVCVVALGLAACGSSPGRPPAPSPRATASPAPGGDASGAAREPVTAVESAVIRGWSTSLRRGNVARAARYFALPAVIANGSPPLRMETAAQARAFNRALPCGAKVVRLKRDAGHRVIATFRLTERPGPGRCGSGVGALARTAFLVDKGHIVQWLRVADPPAVDSTPS
jgi:hypothetical protein